MLDQETKRKINTARDILVGKVPDPKAQVEQITIALIYKFMNDMDHEAEELGGSADFFSGGLEKYRWSRLLASTLSGEARVELYTQGLKDIAHSPSIPSLFRTIFKDAVLPYRDPETFHLFLKEIDGFRYDNSENLGNAFEYLLSVLGSQGDAGQFRTPRHIIDFMVEVTAPTKEDTVLDPACGTAGFLISAYKYIHKVNSSNYDPQEDTPTFAQTDDKEITDLQIQSNGKYQGDRLTTGHKRSIQNHIMGYDISPDMVRLSLVNLYLHQFTQPHIHEYDTLTNEARWDDNFDVILANPPFMTPKGGIRPHQRFQIQANRSEVLFVDYIAEHLKPRGRAAVIVPEGIIFQASNAYKALRKMLVEEYLCAVVSLPSGVFQPYSGVKTSILFLDKAFAKKTTKILFVKIENDGFDLGAQRRRSTANDLPHAHELMQNWYQKGRLEESQTIAHAVAKEKIAEAGDHNLSGERYREVESHTKTKWPMVELGEVLDYEQPTKYIVASTNYNNNYKIPVLTAGKSFILGYTNEMKGVFPKENLPVIIFDDFTTATKYVDFPFKVKSSAMKILHAKKNKGNIKFLFNMIQQIKFNSQTHKRYWISQYSKIKIPLPPLEVQEEIVAEVGGYQKVIDGARQVVAGWKPQIKIDADWPTVELGDNALFQIESGGTPSTKKSEYWGGDINWASFVDLPATDFITTITETKKKITAAGLKNSSAKLLPPNSILISSRATIGRIAITKCELCTNQGFKNIIIKNFKISNLYFVALMVSTLVDRLEQLGEGSTYKEFSKSDLASLSIPLPPLEVQKRIVAEIDAEQRAVDECKKLIGIHEQKIRDKIGGVWGEE